MARIALLMIAFAASILLGCITSVAKASYEKSVEDIIHVGGKILCQDCTQGWNQWVQGAKPIKGARVSIICMDERKRVMYYGSDETDELGEFDMKVNKFVNGKELKIKGCFVRLVSSPDPTCNIPTDFSGGRSGVKLSRPTTMFRNFIKYTAGPFYYTTPVCDEPDTHEYVDSKEGKY